ncbi:IS200/IS605 family transposase [Opitutaceae bacterium]|nr:IS200/IS605 family transposase [Opitutaceae bacterium]
MANTYTSLQYHVVFTTKRREPWLDEDVCRRLWPYLGGIARENGMKALEIGGVADHIHLLLVLPPNLALSKAMQLLKGVSSRWVHENFPTLRDFGWQDGYGAFTVSESQITSVRNYIRNQPEHHRTTTFADEYRAFLEKHGIEFEERYLLG